MKARLISYAFPALLLCGCSSSRETKPLSDSTLRNLHRVDSNLYRSEQPDANDFIALEKAGVTEALNLRSMHGDKNLLEGTRIKEHRVRMDAHDINDYDMAKALKTIKNRRGTMLVHCHHGSDRTGAVCAMYGIMFLNRSRDEAIRELKDPKFGFHGIYINIPKYIETADTAKLRRMINAP